MGNDFSALLEYRGIGAAVLRIITRLESGYEPAEVTRVVDFGAAEGLAFAKRRQPVRWYHLSDCDQPLPARPPLPNLSTRLALQSDFSLTFGADAIWVYHTLRWQFFCCDGRWRDVMVPAVNWFRDMFGATDAVVTWGLLLAGRRIPARRFVRPRAADRGRRGGTQGRGGHAGPAVPAAR